MTEKYQVFLDDQEDEKGAIEHASQQVSAKKRVLFSMPCWLACSIAIERRAALLAALLVAIEHASQQVYANKKGAIEQASIAAPFQ